MWSFGADRALPAGVDENQFRGDEAVAFPTARPAVHATLVDIIIIIIIVIITIIIKYCY